MVFATMNRAYKTLTSTGSVFKRYNRAYSISPQTRPIVFATMNWTYNTLTSTGLIFNTIAELIVSLLKHDPWYTLTSIGLIFNTIAELIVFATMNLAYNTSKGPDIFKYNPHY